jgi:hypothetical protein
MERRQTVFPERKSIAVRYQTSGSPAGFVYR